MIVLAKRSAAAPAALAILSYQAKRSHHPAGRYKLFRAPIACARNDKADIIDVEATAVEKPPLENSHGKEHTTSSPLQHVSSNTLQEEVQAAEVEDLSSKSPEEENVDAKLAASEEAEVEELKQQLMIKLKLLAAGKFEQSGTSMSANEETSERTGGDAESSTKVAPRGTIVSKLLAISTLALFAFQWWPLMPVLMEGIRTLNPEVFLAFLLALPETDLVMSLKLDVIQVATAGHAAQCASVITSCFVHSGLLPLLMSMSVFLEVGGDIEWNYSPLVLLIHIVMCGMGAAVTQLLLQPWNFGISGTGVVVGLVIATLVHQIRAGITPVQLSTKSKVLLLASPLLAAYQPQFGLWGLLGATLAGAIAGVSCFAVLTTLRYLLLVPPFLLICALEIAYKVLKGVPNILLFPFRIVLFLVKLTVQIVLTVISTIREMK
ncbi:hypothetical protein CEUSTIGMA_g11174.t1 [Chlamydomonas eustigma]|uniref:Peptidase S54 rhomboid domain-containing protein n=1 Tax=Chlamydomonas eustigma TaxID=1157962 RepID=A0A250XLE6_9CHLO|nr:hypothetical protein CEUSTIGMA_g11174.t1 [Chlamydomonas eustigma]|eukprot:GAX83749.1 hypothetical protein CEUSTIGMA_g11174.t1 [Chlamydomonas eustigma]